MANSILAKMAVEIVANTASFAAGLDAASAKAKKFQNQIKLVGGAVLGAIAFKEIGQQIIEVTAQFERFGAVLQNALGSRSAAQEALRSIKKFAASTPFEVGEITAAYVRWTNQGLSPSIEKMKMLGDVAASLGAGFEQTAEAFKDLAVGQTKRLEEIGISATQANGKIQLSFKGVNLEIEKNADGVNKALAVYSKLPGVLGTSAAISQTLGGKISNLKDNLNLLAGSIGNSSSGLIGGFLDFANNALGGLNDALDNQVDKLTEERIELNVLVGAITDVNTSTLARKTLLEELNRKYPDFLKNLDIEKVTNEQLNKRLDDVNKQFLKKIALAAAEEKLIEKQKELNAAIDDEVEALKEAEKNRGKTVVRGAEARVYDLEAIARAKAVEAQKEQVKIQNELNELVGRYSKTWDDAEKSNLDYFTASKKSAEEQILQIKKQYEQLGELALLEKTRSKLSENPIFKGDELLIIQAAAKEVDKIIAKRKEGVKETEKEKKTQKQINDELRQSAFLVEKINIKDLIVDPFKQAKIELEKLNEKQKDFEEFKKAFDFKFPDAFTSIRKQFDEYRKNLKPAIEANDALRISVQDLNGAFGSAAAEGLQSFFVGLGDVANKQISFGDNLLKAISGFMKQFGEQLIALGIAKLGLDNLFVTGIGAPAAIAAGVALVAAAGAVSKRLAKKSQSIGRGGSGGGSTGFSGQTMNASGMQNNIQISGTLTGSGRDLVAVINNTSFDNKVRKGG